MNYPDPKELTKYVSRCRGATVEGIRKRFKDYSHMETGMAIMQAIRRDYIRLHVDRLYTRRQYKRRIWEKKEQ